MKLEDEYCDFWEKGYVIVRNAFEQEEMKIIKNAITKNSTMNARTKIIMEECKNGKKPSFSTIFVWNDTSGEDLFSLATRSHKIFDRLECFFKDEVYDYHNKVPLKYPGMIGFPYHQDYGYWYKMGNIYPDMATVFIALDQATNRNGCLKLIEGSHKMGRIDHIEYEGIDPVRLDVIKQRMKEIYVELNIGDLVIFHANTLHASDDNNSSESRLALIGTYNTKHNDPYTISCGHPRFKKQEKVYRKITENDIDNLPDFELNYYEY